MRWLLPLSLAILVGCGEKTDDTGEPDGDGDGFTLSEDCDDTDADVNPGAAERCNGVDDDCDGDIDEEGAEGSDLFYADTDGDGYGDENNTIEICDMPSGYVASAYDCDDTNADTNPAGTELCDGADNDCDGEIDEDASDAPEWYADNDEDGYGDDRDIVEACDQPDGYVDNAEDCDDDDSDRNPDVDEICDGSDNNCDGDIDEDSAVDASTWYADADGDGYGSSDLTTPACAQPDDYVGNDGDCDDANGDINPDADEVCNDADDDCDGDIDEDATDAPTWYADADSDGFGDLTSPLAACDQPSGYLSDGSDCDDDDSAINPYATEICDGLDNDCDGDVDAEGLVTLNGLANFSTIAEAVITGASGSEVVVCDGTYVENVSISSDLTLSSQNGSGSTTIEGDGAGPCITIQSATVDVTGFTITDGAGAPYSATIGSIVGGGLNILGTSTVTLADLDVIDNEAEYGAGLFLDATSIVSMSDSIVQLNDADVSGGGMYLFEATLSLTSVVFEDNQASYGGGLYVDASSLDFDACTVEDNYGSDYGGGAYLSAGTLTASDDTEFTANSAGDWGGGAFLTEGSSWSGGQITDNEADHGGGFHIDAGGGSGASNEIEDVYCAENWADTSGGCAYIEGDVNLTSVEIFANGSLWGAGLFIDATVYLLSSTVEENTSDYNGGGAYISDNGLMLSINSDWGSGSTDNSPDDVYVQSLGANYTSFGTGETFTCSDTTGSCG